MYWGLSAAKAITKRSRRVENPTAANDQRPTGVGACLFANDLEIVDRDAEDWLKPPVEEKTLAPSDRLKPCTGERLCEMVPQYSQIIGWPYSDSRSWQQGRVTPALPHSGRHWFLGVPAHVTIYGPHMPMPSFDWVYADVASDC